MNYSHSSSYIPYEKIEQQPIQESFCLYEGTNTVEYEGIQVHDFSFECTYPFELTTAEEKITQFTSHEEESIETRTYTHISGIHEKYLNQDTSPLPKKMHQSGRKAFTSQKSNLYSKKMIRNKNEAQRGQKSLTLDPLTQGREGLQIGHKELLQTLREKIGAGEQEKNAVFLQLGLKMPKSLGKGKADRDLQAILSFLENGELCPEYVSDFIQLMGS